MNSEVKVEEIMIEKEGMQIIPSTIYYAEESLGKNPFLLKKVLEQITGFDYVLLDCPPHLGVLTMSSL